MNNPRITIITPSFNQGEFIERTILSILNQDYPNLEYIICDGGSSDKTIDIIKKYEQNITWWCSEKDRGQTHAINKGMRRATGEVVGWINSDDMLLPGALKVVAEFYQKHPKVDFANGLTIEIDKDNRIINFTNTVMSRFFARHGCYNVSQLGMFWRRSLFDNLGYLDESFHATMDLEWLIRVYESGGCVKRINKNLGAIRIYDQTKTAIGGSIWDRDFEEIKKRYNGLYYPNRKSFYYLLFQCYKFLDGCFFRNRIMKMKYVGRKVAEYHENV